ncbi:hypothetical protein EZ428_18165 [Pedobacter frigiditerrae]|uniref:Uncharacterized protein n=1 Tax=Pedobacter frigiditerrae TaxID=2530452 RepID=A0A4V2MI07_9SPHI|nr:hypothetical protein [Pedobacter frigiditerrae]TCC88566.1 hypothetical protein EZ428_18165 [Pedobacter frigiditerrae]
MTPDLLLRISAELTDYYSEWILIADRDIDGSIVMFTKPFIDFEGFTCHLCDTILDTIPLNKGLAIKLYGFGQDDNVYIKFC